MPQWRSGNDNVLRSYGYKYDAMNRLTNAIYGKPNNSVKITNNYNEWLSYDANGNILSLGRNGISDSHNDLIQIDDLEYHYKDDNSNILIGVNDHSGNTAGFKKDQITAISETNPDYFYDDHGNLVADHTKEITNITYNHLNLPTKVTFHGTNKFIEYLYTATGQKVQGGALKNSPVGCFSERASLPRGQKMCRHSPYKNIVPESLDRFKSFVEIFTFIDSKH